MDVLDAIQWPAMFVTVIAAWMIASQKKLKRNWGFWLFLLSNLLWIVWALHDHAYALILLQLSLAINILLLRSLRAFGRGLMSDKR